MSKLYDILNSLITRVKSVEAQSASGGQPDYLQNDPAASDYIKNRPFYEGLSVLLPETEIPFTNGQFMQQGYTGEEFTVGETYKVTWNGTEYTCIAQDVPEMFGTAVGNIGLAMGGTDTGEPFVIGTSASQGVFMVAVLDGSTSATVKIEGGTVKKLDDKYLSDNVVKVETVIGKEIVPEIPCRLLYGKSWFFGAETVGVDTPLDFKDGSMYAVYLNGEKHLAMCSYHTEIFDGVFIDGLPCLKATDGSFTIIKSVDTESNGVPTSYMWGINVTNSYDALTIKINEFSETINKPIPWDAISDKPFGESMSEFLPETELTFTNGGYEQGGYSGEEFAIGETYVVTWNGTEYSCVAQDVPDMGGTAVGNVGLAMGGTDTGEPFFVGTAPSQKYFVVVATDGSTSATVKISGVTVKKLDPKFIPTKTLYISQNTSGYAYRSPEGVVNADSSERITAAELFNTVLEERPLFAQVSYDGIIFSYYTGYRVDLAETPEDCRIMVMDFNPSDEALILREIYPAEYSPK